MPVMVGFIAQTISDRHVEVTAGDCFALGQFALLTPPWVLHRKDAGSFFAIHATHRPHAFLFITQYNRNTSRVPREVEQLFCCQSQVQGLSTYVHPQGSC